MKGFVRDCYKAYNYNEEGLVMKTPWDIQYEAFLHASGIYTEKHARLYADLAKDLMEDGSFSILYEGVAHACYTPILLEKAPHLTCFILAPLAVLPAYHVLQGLLPTLLCGKSLANRCKK